MKRLILHVCATVLAAMISSGCGSSEPTAPKTDLSEKEKQQLKDLQDQRNKEWGGSK